MQRLPNSFRRVDLLYFQHGDLSQRRFPASGPPRAIQIYAHRFDPHYRRSRGFSATRTKLDRAPTQHRRLLQRLEQAALFIGQSPVLTGSNDKVDSMLLTDFDWFVEIRFAISDVNPLHSRRRSPRAFEHLGPTLRFARTTQSLPTSLSVRCRSRRAASLAQQSHQRAFRPLLQRPAFHTRGQSTVQFEASPASITDASQILGRRMFGIIEQSRVLDDQIFSGLTAAGSGPFQMRTKNGIEGRSTSGKEAVGRF